MHDEIMPPDGRGGPPRNQKIRTARQMLESLQFDPLVELVETQRKFKSEAARQELIRSGDLVELKQDGKPKAYSAQTHHNALSESARISKDLTEFFYKKAAQESENTVPPIAFTVQLTHNDPTPPESEPDL